MPRAADGVIIRDTSSRSRRYSSVGLEAAIQYGATLQARDDALRTGGGPIVHAPWNSNSSSSGSPTAAARSGGAVPSPPRSATRRRSAVAASSAGNGDHRRHSVSARLGSASTTPTALRRSSRNSSPAVVAAANGENVGPENYHSSSIAHEDDCSTATDTATATPRRATTAAVNKKRRASHTPKTTTSGSASKKKRATLTNVDAAVAITSYNSTMDVSMLSEEAWEEDGDDDYHFDVDLQFATVVPPPTTRLFVVAEHPPVTKPFEMEPPLPTQPVPAPQRASVAPQAILPARSLREGNWSLPPPPQQPSTATSPTSGSRVRNASSGKTNWPRPPRLYGASGGGSSSSTTSEFLPLPRPPATDGVAATLQAVSYDDGDDARSADEENFEDALGVTEFYAAEEYDHPAASFPKASGWVNLGKFVVVYGAILAALFMLGSGTHRARYHGEIGDALVVAPGLDTVVATSGIIAHQILGEHATVGPESDHCYGEIYHSETCTLTSDARNKIDGMVGLLEKWTRLQECTPSGNPYAVAMDDEDAPVFAYRDVAAALGLGEDGALVGATVRHHDRVFAVPSKGGGGWLLGVRTVGCERE